MNRIKKYWNNFLQTLHTSRILKIGTQRMYVSTELLEAH